MTVPLIKWAGGKRQLLDELMKLVPKIHGTYFEPFFGGGALFFALKTEGWIEKAVVSDLNSDLYNMYRTIQSSPFRLLEELNKLKFSNKEEDYYEARNIYNSLPESADPEYKAALLIYLNRHCYNGLYRVNSMGKFNVPFGKYNNPNLPDRERLLEVSTALRDTDVLNLDFEETLESASGDDFVYLDPPYFPLSSTSAFTDYQTGGFGLQEQERLANVFRKLDSKGVSVMMSNSATPEIMELYDGFNTNFVKARRLINSKSGGRGEIKEVLVTNF